ncbi:MAG: hypothetical protein WCO56_22795 [Verrucomicrobiota bacterium]
MSNISLRSVLPAIAMLWLLASQPLRAGWVWIEGESPTANKMNRHPWWYDQVKRDQLSGGDFLSNFNKDKPGEAEYRFKAPKEGTYDFWLRANPVKSKLAWALNGGTTTEVNFQGEKYGEVNLAQDGKPDLRFIAWIKVGKVTLKAGDNSIRFNTAGGTDNHGLIDCFLFIDEPFQPMGTAKPDQMGAELSRLAKENQGWQPWNPTPDDFHDSPMDLRFLNEKFAGEHGPIGAKDGHFIMTGNGQPVRFWAVNGPPHDATSPAALRNAAKLLAKHGVNLVRSHGGLFDGKTGELKAETIAHRQEIVEAMKAEGIYTHFSIYFPLWLSPKPGDGFLPGYDGKQHPFAVHMYNPQFIERHQAWFRALLLTPNPKTGKRLVDDPAVFGLEIVNEDSFFFWTFDEKNIPDVQLRPLEKQFGDWLIKKYGSLEQARAAWGNVTVKRDAPAEGRMGFRPLWAVVNERKVRDQDTARFLYEVQSRYYAAMYQFLRKLGFRGVINASNWTTASPEYLGPLEKMSYAECDFIDRHGYFGCGHKGSNAEWSMRDGHTYSDRSALRFENESPGKPRQFNHPVMEIKYAGKPSMISETTFTRPNRYRSEAPLYYAAYGALQDTDAQIHFAFDGVGWNVKPGFWMQPWTLMSPAMMGQFPAAALLYRQGLVSTGKVLAEVELNKDELLALKGTPLPQDAAFDELRLKDVPAAAEVKPGQRLDPLLHYAGQAAVRFVTGPGSTKLADLKPYINRPAQSVTSSTGELKLDYGKGVLTLNAAKAQGLSGALQANGPADLHDLAIESGMKLGHIIAVALDNQPLATSSRILLQVMSEEKNGGFQTESLASQKRIASIGKDPWQFKEFTGTVKFKRPDAAQLKVTPLDLNGYPTSGTVGNAREIKLLPATAYYWISSDKR